MGKHSNFKRRKNDAYMTTDPRAVIPLVQFFGNGYVNYYEPCAGDGSLVTLFNTHSNFVCNGYSDIEKDARTTQYSTIAECFVTNPPWSRFLLHDIIENLRKQKPTWLLFDADWMHTQQAIPYIQYCKIIVSVGRVRWIEGTETDGKTDCAWYLFIGKKTKTTFIPRNYR